MCAVWESHVVPAPIPATAYLAAEEMAEHTAALQVPDNDEAPAVADEDLGGVSGVLLQGLHHFKHPPMAGLLRQPLQHGVRADGLVLQCVEGWQLYHKHVATFRAQVK